MKPISTVYLKAIREQGRQEYRGRLKIFRGEWRQYISVDLAPGSRNVDPDTDIILIADGVVLMKIAAEDFREATVFSTFDGGHGLTIVYRVDPPLPNS